MTLLIFLFGNIEMYCVLSGRFIFKFVTDGMCPHFLFLMECTDKFLKIQFPNL